jgi:predicted RND superfamily exporter protein
MVSALHELVAEFESEDLTIRLAGESVLGHRATAISWMDTTIFTVLAFLVAMTVLLVLFRRASAALLPIVVVAASLTSTFGAMAALAIPFSLPTQIIPNFLIAVGVCDAVHILTIFYQAWNRGEGKQASVVHALGHSGLAVVLTSLTTAGGLLSFLAAEITPVARLGTIGPLGVILTLFYTLTLLPALLVVIPLSRRERAERGSFGRDGALASQLARVGAAVAKRPRMVLFTALVLCVIAATGVAKIRFSHDPYDWLLPDDPVRIAVQRMDTALHGISAVEILIDTGREDGLYDPGVLNRIEAASRDALSIQDGPVRVGKAISIIDIVKEINQALNANDPAHYRVPDERALIAQELLLFENSGSDDLTQVSDTRFRTARLTLRVPLVDAFYYGAFLEDLGSRMREILGPAVSVEMTGATVLGNRTFSVVIVSMFRAYGLALLIITPLMIAMIGSLRIGLVSMIPNLLPVYFTLALMGWLDIPLGMSTLLLGSIVIGVAVDDTIHFLHKFDGYHRSSGDAHAAIRRTLETTGAALFATSLVLAASFGSYTLGHMTGVVQFGILAPFAILVAFLADLTLSPALLVLVRGRRRCLASDVAHRDSPGSSGS